MDLPLHSGVKLSVSWVEINRWQQSKATRCKHQQARFWPLYFRIRKAFCSLITLRKKEPSIANIIWHYWCIWRKKSQKNWHKWKRKKCSFTKTMHRVTSWSQQWQNYRELHLELLLHPLRSGSQIWVPATTGCLQTSKECSRERDLAPMKKWYWKLRRILRSKTNCSTKKGIELLEKHWNQSPSRGIHYVDE